MLRETADVQQNVLDELRDEPSLDASRVQVHADDGVVTLTGSVNTYAQKVSAEEAAKRVLGVRAVANDIEVQLRDGDDRYTDTDIATAIVDAIQILRRHGVVTDERISAIVDHGWVVLEGTVQSKFQKDAAERAIRQLSGVKAVMNAIAIKPSHPASPNKIKDRIARAFQRNTALNARRISVDELCGPRVNESTVVFGTPRCRVPDLQQLVAGVEVSRRTIWRLQKQV